MGWTDPPAEDQVADSPLTTPPSDWTQPPSDEPEAVANTDQGIVDTQIQTSNAILGMGPSRVGEMAEAFRLVVSDLNRSDTAIIPEMYKQLGAAGVIDPKYAMEPLSTVFVDTIRDRANQRVDRLFASSGIDKVTGEGSYNDKRLVRREAMAFEALASAPVSGRTLADLVKSVYLSRYDQRLSDEFGKAQALKVGSPEAQKWAEWRARLDQVGPVEWLDFYAHTLYDRNVRPTNSLDAQYLDEESGHHLGVMGLRMISGPDPGAEGLLNGKEIFRIHHEVFGDEHSKVFADDLERNKVKYIRERLGAGLEQDDGKIITGRRVDHQSFLALAPTGAMERLVARAIADSPDGKAGLATIRQEQGASTAVVALHETTMKTMGDTMEKLATEISQPTTGTEKEVTEAVYESQDFRTKVGLNIMEVLEDLRRIGVSAVESADRVASSSSFVRDTIIQTPLQFYTGDAHSATRARTFAEGMSTIWTINTTALRKSKAELQMRAKELGYIQWSGEQSSAKFGDWWHMGLWAAAKEGSYMDWIQESFPNMYKTVDKNNQTMADFYKSPFELGKAVKAGFAAMGNTGYMLFAGPIEMAGVIGDNPYEAGGFMAQGAVLGPLTKITSGWARTAHNRWAYTWRLAHDLNNIVTFHPEQVARFRDAAKAALPKVSAPKKVKILNDLVAQAEAFEASYRANGVWPDRGETARVLRRAFPEIRDELGYMGHTLGSKNINRGFLADTNGLLAKALSDKAPNANIEALLGSMRTQDLVLNVLSDMTGAKGIAEEMAASYKSFVAENGRAPSPAEALKIAPKPVHDLYGLMVAAEKNNIKSPVIAGLVNRILGNKVDAAGIVKTADAMMNEYMATSLELVRKTHSFGIARERGTLVLDLAQRKAKLAADTAAMELDYVRPKLKEYPEVPEIARYVQELEDYIIQQQKHVERFNAEMDNLWRHPASKPWALSPDVRQMLFGEFGYLNASSAGLLVDSHPGTFGTVSSETFFTTKRRALPPERIAELAAMRKAQSDKIGALRRELKAMEKDPTKVDSQLADLRKTKADLEKQQADVLARPADDTTAFVDGQILPEDRNLVVKKITDRIKDVDAAIEARLLRLKSKDVISKEVIAKQTDLDAAMNAAKALGEEHARIIDEGIIDSRVVDEEAYARFQKMLEHDGMGENERILTAMRDRLSQAAADKWLGVNANPFMHDFAPVWYKGELLHQELKAAGWKLASAMERTEMLMKELRRRPTMEREILAKAFKENNVDVIRAAGLEKTAEEQLASYFEREQATYREMWAMLDDIGKIPTAVVESWKKGDYDPRLSGMAMRTYSAKGPEARKILGPQELKATPELTALGMDWGEFTFRRELGKWRLRVEQPDVIVDKLFDSEQALQEYMNLRYGPEAFRDIGKWRSDETATGRTYHGERVTIGKPLTEAELRLQDPIQGPEARLIQLRKALKDAHLHLVNEALNLNGDMIMTDDQFHASQQYSNPDVRKLYVYIGAGEKSRIAFGNLAGKWVHRTILREMGDASRVYDHLGAIADSWRAAVEENQKFAAGIGKQLGLSIGTSSLSRASRAIFGAIKDNLVLKSVRTWVANFMFWTISDHFAGTEVFTQEGMMKLLDNLTLRRGKRAMQVANSSLIAEARAQGIVGGMFENDTLELGDMMREVMSIDNKANLQTKLAQRQALVNQLRDLELSGNATKGQIRAVEEELLNLKVELADMNKSWLRQTGRKLAGFFFRNTTATGEPANRFWTNMRARYNWMDTAYKLSQFEQLRAKGLDPVTAGNVVRRFSQDYANLPSWIRQGNPFVMSLIPAFPYELARIMGNAARLAPTKFLSLTLALPVLNLMSFTYSGIGWDKAIGMIQTRGKTDSLQAVASMFNTLYLTDPGTGEFTDEINVSSYWPGASLFQARGWATRMYDKWVPPEKRDLVGQFGAMGLNVFSNFFGSNPATNFIGGTIQGVDPMTGEPIVSEKDSIWHNMKVAARLLRQQVLPPWVGGRDYDAILQASEANVSPKTGRQFKADQSITAWARSIFGVTWRGKTIQEIGNALHLTSQAPHPLVDEADLIMSQTYKAASLFGDAFGQQKVPVLGEYNELRNLAYASIDTSLSEEQRAAAYEEVRKLYTKKIETELNGMKLSHGETDRAFKLWIERTTSNDPLATFKAQNVVAQAFVLASIDQMGVRDGRIKDLVTAMQMSDLGALRSPPDEEMVDRAVALLDQRIAEGGRQVNKRLLMIRDYINTYMRANAKIKTINETVTSPVREAKEEFFRAPPQGSPEDRTPSSMEEAARLLLRR